VRDLFSPAGAEERLPLPGADVSYLPHLDVGRAPHELLASLISEVPWRAESVTVWGKSHPQPRLVAWYGDSGSAYSYSGVTLDPLPWTDVLRSLKSDIEEFTGASFNSVLLNYYRNNRDSMGFHSDDEPELGPRPVIASYSLGAIRTLIFKPKDASLGQTTRVPLESGSLLVMRGETQRNWKHGIEKERVACGPRVNLTFRKIFKR